MGQKTNPIVLRLGKTQIWNSQYFEKKTTETALYAFKQLEIRKLIYKFFKDNGLIIQNLKLHYLNESSLYIFISYYLTLKSNFLVEKITKQQKIKLIKSRVKVKKRKKYIKLYKNIKNYIEYQQINYNKTLNEFIQKQNYRKAKKTIKLEKNSFKIRRISLLKYYKECLAIRANKKINLINSNSFLKKLQDSLHLFIGKNLNIFLICQQLNKNLKQNFDIEKSRLLKKKLVNLKKYKQNEFFKEGINLLLMCTTKKNSSNLLTQFIASQLKKLKRHNFFLKFIKATLTVFINSKFSGLQGIKIKVKGRFNGAPRAKHKIINVGNGVSSLTLSSDIDYSEETSYTSNGTFGIKVWMS